MKKEKLCIKPKKGKIDRNVKIFIWIIFIMVLVATIILLVVFWDAITKFLTTSLTFFIFIGLGVIFILAPILICKRIDSHKDDEF